VEDLPSLSWLVGDRDAGYAYEFLRDVATRLKRVPLTTDGHGAYLSAVVRRLRP
jgi:hypothetical protein